jgi:ketosteroid isomerase-like protein
MFVVQISSVGGNVSVMKRGEDNETVMSTFAEDLLYINVGFAEKHKDDVESETNAISTLLEEATRVRSIEQQVASLGDPADRAQRLVRLFYLARNSDVQYPATRLFSHQEYGL